MKPVDHRSNERIPYDAQEERPMSRDDDKSALKNEILRLNDKIA